MPSSRRIPGPRPLAFSLGSSEAITTRADPGRQDRVGARRLAALVGAGLERHVQRRPRRLVTAGPAVLQRRHLGVRAAELGVEALADHLAVAHQHRADQRVRADPAAAALGQLERPSEVDPILLCDGGWHS